VLVLGSFGQYGSQQLGFMMEGHYSLAFFNEGLCSEFFRALLVLFSA
jgi:hypothetical protein